MINLEPEPCGFTPHRQPQRRLIGFFGVGQHPGRREPARLELGRGWTRQWTAMWEGFERGRDVAGQGLSPGRRRGILLQRAAAVHDLRERVRGHDVGPPGRHAEQPAALAAQPGPVLAPVEFMLHELEVLPAQRVEGVVTRTFRYGSGGRSVVDDVVQLQHPLKSAIAMRASALRDARPSHQPIELGVQYLGPPTRRCAGPDAK